MKSTYFALVITIAFVATSCGGSQSNLNQDSLQMEQEIKKLDSSATEMYKADTALENANKKLDDALKNLK